MRRFWIIASVLLAGYLVTGFYVVRGNEKVAVHRFGRVVRTAEGRVSLAGSGLHYALPWPCSAIERINLNEVRTLSIGMAEIAEPGAGGFLRSLDSENQSQFLTGDKNILHLQINTQYRLAEPMVDDFLFRSAAPEQHLERIVEGVATELIARSGVDFVHPLGQVELNALLTLGVRRIADEQRLGLDVDDVAINAVYPPILVKSYFLDVTTPVLTKSIRSTKRWPTRSLAPPPAKRSPAAHSTKRRRIVGRRSNRPALRGRAFCG